MTPPSPDRVLEDELHFAWYGRALQRRWKLLAAGAIAGGLLGYAAVSARPVVYQGTTTLLVVPPASSMSSDMNTATFRAILENGSLAAQVIDELGLNQPPHALTPQGFLADALTVEEVRGTNVVKVKIRLRDARLAAEASRRLALKAIALTQRIHQQEGSVVQDQLKQHLEESAARRAAAEQALLTYRRSAQVELVERDAQAMLVEREGLLKLVVDIEVEKARLSAAEQEIKKQDRLLPAGRVVGAEEAMRRAQAPPGTGANSDLLDLTNPYMNPVYQTLDFQIATSRARLAGLEKQRQQLMDVRKIGAEELTKLNELYGHQIELARLQTSFDLARSVHSDLTTRYEESRARAFGNTAQLQLIDEAIPPDRPLPRRRLQYTALGFAAGLIGAGAIALAWKGREKTQPA